MHSAVKDIILSWGTLIVSVVFNAVGVFVIKWRINQLDPFNYVSFKSTVAYFYMLLKSPIVFAGVILFGVAPFLFAVALSRMEITVAYPVQIGLNFVILVLLALCFLGEHLTFYKALGFLLVFIGVLLLNKG